MITTGILSALFASFLARRRAMRDARQKEELVADPQENRPGPLEGRHERT